jgi:hypothetical protein
MGKNTTLFLASTLSEKDGRPLIILFFLNSTAYEIKFFSSFNENRHIICISKLILGV